MWPWEHLAVGYLCYSLYAHVRFRRAPRSLPAVAVAVGTQFPDLVDKPLAWSFEVLPSGHSLAHSALVAVPVALLAVFVGRRASRERGAVGTAFAVGYLSHLPGDALYPLVLGHPPNIDFLLWPLVPVAEAPTGLGFVEIVRLLFARFVDELVLGAFSAYLLLELALLVGVFALWVADGVPPLGALRRGAEPPGEEAT